MAIETKEKLVDKLEDLELQLESNQSEQMELRSVERFIRSEIKEIEGQLEDLEDTAEE